MATTTVSRALSGASLPAVRQNATKAWKSPAVRAVVITAGVAGLAALTYALLGPRRSSSVLRQLNAAAVTPLLAAARPQADRLWDETQPWRDSVSRILASINTEEVRTMIADRLSQWIERLR